MPDTCDYLTTVLYAIEDTIWNKSPSCTCETFLDCWQALPTAKRRKVFDLYYTTLQTVYYDRDAFGQTVIRAVGEL